MEVRRLVDRLHLLPGDRRRDRRAFAGAGTIRHDRRRASLVAQIVDEDASLALRFRKCRRELLGVHLRHRSREPVREVFHFGPFGPGHERRDDMHALAAGEHRSEEHTSELPSLMRISYAVFCLKKKTQESLYSTNTSIINQMTSN